jgi:hypothetical protein
MTKMITNTLTRWHKVADRIKQATSKLKEENLHTLQVAHGIDGDTFMVIKETLSAAAGKAIQEKTVLFLAMQDALFNIRRALAHANTEHGVSDLLNQMEQTKQLGEYFESLLSTATGSLSQKEYIEVLDKKKRANDASRESSMYGIRITFLSPEQIIDLTAKRDAAQREVNALADRLADANATKLRIGFDDVVVAAMGF